MSAGGHEVLLDHTVDFASKARQAGAQQVELAVEAKMQHVFPLFFSFFPEAHNELSRIVLWVQEKTKTA